MINVDGLTQMVQESPNYKVVVKDGQVFVVPAEVVDKIDFSKNTVGLQNGSVLIVRGDGRATKSRWTNVAEDCPCEIKRRQEERQRSDGMPEDWIDEDWTYYS